MSKKTPRVQSNTLLSYFSRAPPKPKSNSNAEGGDEQNKPPAPAKPDTKKDHADEVDDISDVLRCRNATPGKRKAKVLACSSDSDDDVILISKKKKKVVESDDDDYQPEDAPDKSESFESEDVDSDDIEEIKASMKRPRATSTPKTTKKGQTFRTPSTKKGQTFRTSSTKKGQTFRTPLAKNNTPSGKGGDGNTTQTAIQAQDRQWPHLQLEWLKPEKIKDENRNPMLLDNGELNPDYDFGTLYVPESFLASLTPAMRQWWQFKKKHFDTILFFKMGKFYELFHMDAVIATRELQILFMKGDYAHAGFPEKGYKRYADALIQQGYKVARVEQMETPDMMAERLKKMCKPTKFDKVVAREICRISSAGTRFMSYIDSDALPDNSTYLYSIAFEGIESTSMDTVKLGVSFVDTSIGKIYLAQLIDDRYLSKLRTLLAHYSPVEVLYERHAKHILAKFFTATYDSVRQQSVRQLWTAEKTLKYVYQRQLLENYPVEFKAKLFDIEDQMETSPMPEMEMAVSALGGIIEYFEKALIADDILSLKQFEIYTHPEAGTDLSHQLPNSMILDSLTCKNLDIFSKEKNCLWKLIDSTATAFGKRLLRQWLCQPLCNPLSKLVERQDAVRELAESDRLQQKMKIFATDLRKFPDLQRCLLQIHSQSSLKRATNHPDSRAILFEEQIYRKRRIGNFLAILQGLERSCEIIEDIATSTDYFKSMLLHSLVTFVKEGGKFPDVREKVQHIRETFNFKRAKEASDIIPNANVDKEYDDSVEEIENAKRDLDTFLRKQAANLGCRAKYYDSGKTRYQLEIPDSAVQVFQDNNPDSQLKSSKKGFKRFYTPQLLEMIANLENAEATNNRLRNDFFRRILERFNDDYKTWSALINCLAQLDALWSLAKTKEVFQLAGAQSCCLPVMVPPAEGACPVFEAQNLRNATLFRKRELTPNDLELTDQTLVLTGPNMSGKTTLERSAGLAIVLAQVGAFVPATELRLTPVDRIFTRIGAYDNVIESQSTFMVEMSEAALMVRHATPHSFILVDELGRGTSAADSNAIAHSFLKHISENIKCRAMFSTHFHTILEDLDDANIKRGYMSYMIENEGSDIEEENIYFLYKLNEGVCTKSYGYNVAKMANIPLPIVREAHHVGHAHHVVTETERLLTQLNHQLENGGGDGKSFDAAKLDRLAGYLLKIALSSK